MNRSNPLTGQPDKILFFLHLFSIHLGTSTERLGHRIGRRRLLILCHAPGVRENRIGRHIDGQRTHVAIIDPASQWLKFNNMIMLFVSFFSEIINTKNLNERKFDEKQRNTEKEDKKYESNTCGVFLKMQGRGTFLRGFY